MQAIREAGERVQLSPRCVGAIERVDGDVAEVRWDTGARCPVPIDWLGEEPGTSTPELAVTRSCARCGLELRGARVDSRYCSNACRQHAYRGRRAAV